MWCLKVGIALSLGMVFPGVSFCRGTVKNQSNKNQLHKVYHHQMECDKQGKSNSLELGSLVCYFSQPPLVNSLTDAKEKKDRNEKNDRQKLVFFFPWASVSSTEAKSSIEKLHKEANGWYSIEFQEVKAPTQGITLQLTFDPRKVGLKYDVFDSIGQQKGIVFRFFNQETLEILSTKSCKPILNMAHMRKPSLIAIDCGHGGADSGTIGVFKYTEKDVTWHVGKELALLLEKEGFKTVLTRNGDETVALDARTTFANAQKADLFVSVHANNAANIHAQGVETFWMDPALLVAVDDTLSFVHKKLVCEKESEKSKTSNVLAHHIHKQVLTTLNEHRTVKDRSVHKSVSQVLLGTLSPSVLIEVGFLSNPEEAQFLGTSDYQKLIAHGICRGIKSYAKQFLA